MDYLSKVTISGYIYEIIGFEEGLTKFKINLVSTRGTAIIIAKTDKLYVGAYIDAVGHWESYASKKRHFISSKLQIVIPSNVETIAKDNINSIIPFNKSPSAPKIDSQEMLEQAIMEDILIFCKKYNIPARHSSLIYKTYKDDTTRILNENPYKLAFDIQIISFDQAEKIAIQLGIYKHLSPTRIEAGIKYVLFEEAMKGDVSASSLVKKVSVLLNIREEIAAKALEKAVREKSVTLS